MIPINLQQTCSVDFKEFAVRSLNPYLKYMYMENNQVSYVLLGSKERVTKVLAPGLGPGPDGPGSETDIDPNIPL